MSRIPESAILMNNVIYARFGFVRQAKRQDFYRFSLFLLYFFIAFILIRSVWPGEDHMYFDAGWYWSVISSSDLDNLPKIYRGYLYPYILFALKTLGVSIGIPAERLVILMNAAGISIFTVYFIPNIICIQTSGGAGRAAARTDKGINPARFFIGSVLLSDFPALFFCAAFVFCLLRIESFIVNKNRSVFCTAAGLMFLGLLAGASAYASYNIRAVYLYGIIASLIWWLLRNRHHGVCLKLPCTGIVLGVLIVAYPQMCVNKKYNDTYLPLVPTVNFSTVDLKNWQIAQGLTVDRYEGFVGRDSVQTAEMRFDDKAGTSLEMKEKVSNGVSLTQLAKLACKYPLDIAGIYWRHLINYLTPVWRHCYIIDLHVNTAWVALPGIVLWLIFFYQLFLIKREQWKNWLKNEAWAMVPFISICLFMIPAAVEVRFFIAAYSIMYGYLAWRADFRTMLAHFREHTVSVALLLTIAFLFWISVMGSTLSGNAVSPVLFNYGQ